MCLVLVDSDVLFLENFFLIGGFVLVVVDFVGLVIEVFMLICVVSGVVDFEGSAIMWGIIWEIKIGGVFGFSLIEGVNMVILIGIYFDKGDMICCVVCFKDV